MSTERGFTLIELVMFIVIVGVGVAGILSVLNLTAFHSADPLIRKQMLSIAEGLLAEVELQPFTFCDPTDPNVATAASALLDVSNTDGTKCKATLEVLGPEGETRTSAITPFNNVNDYYVGTGFALPSQIADITGGNSAPDGYSATIQIVPEALNGIPSAACANAGNCTAMNVLRIAVTVCHAANCPSLGADSLTLEGYRTRHSPNFSP